jgi:YVTN family beta-propeller protein
MKTLTMIAALFRGMWVFVLALSLAGSLPVALLAAEPPDPSGARNLHVSGSGPAGQSTLGDFVWYDTNANGLENLGEPGIDGVTLRLYLDNNDGEFDFGTDIFVAEVVTGDDPGTPTVEKGWYDFQIYGSNEAYWVYVVPGNFTPGGALYGHAQTNAAVVGSIPLFVYLPEGVQDYNDADIGFLNDGSAPTITPTVTGSPTATFTATASVTSTATPTEGPSPTPSATPTVTNTPASTWTPSATPTPSETPSPTATHTSTATSTPSVTPTPTATCPPEGCTYIIYLPVVIGEPVPTPIPTSSPSPTPTSTATIEITGLAHPKGVVVREDTHDIYVTSRDNNRVYRLDGVTLAEEASGATGNQPWGVDVNTATGKVYVANWASRDVTVLDAETLTGVATIPVNGHPTHVRINPTTSKVFVVLYGANALAVIDSSTDTLEAEIYAGGVGAWGLAVNPNLNRVYVSTRDSGTVTTLEGSAPYKLLESQTRQACNGVGSSPYSMDFSPANNRLYIACAPYGSVDTAMIYKASASGLLFFTSAPLGQGGPDGGGGVAVNPADGRVYFTNSAANSVTVLDGNNHVAGAFAAGAHPFAIDVDSTTGRVYVVNRDINTITIH